MEISSGVLDHSSIRAIFYSHDTLGLGHLRRTLLISEGLRASFPNLSSLIITGSAMAHGFRVSPGVDYLKLPCAEKLDNELYRSRALPMKFEELQKMRQELILQATAHYRPHFFFVDSVPLGMKGELRNTLNYVKENLPDTCVFLTLRDVVDSSASVLESWQASSTFDALVELFNHIFICGLPEVFDPITEYRFPETLFPKTSFCGYIARPYDRKLAENVRRQVCRKGEKIIVVTVGGGADGEALIRAYLKALPEISRTNDVSSVVVMGPDMAPVAQRRFRSALANNERVTLIDFCHDLVAYLANADLVVSMAGHNTISEILFLRKKALVIPRVWPRTEQLIRSQRLEELGLLKVLVPENLNESNLAKNIIEVLDASGPEGPALEFTAIQKITDQLKRMLEHKNKKENSCGSTVGQESLGIIESQGPPMKKEAPLI